MKKDRKLETASQLSAEAMALREKLIGEWSFDTAATMILNEAMAAYDRLQQAKAILARDGIVFTDKFGQIKPHPCLIVERDSRLALLRQLNALHLDLEPIRDAVGRPPNA